MNKIRKDIEKVEDDWKNDQFEKAGEDVVDILFVVLGGPTDEPIPDTPEFLY